MKSKKGITLITLIITTIVSLILAGISIYLIVEENEILDKSINSSKANKREEAEAKVYMEVAESYDETARINLKDLNDNLRNDLENVKIKKGKNHYEFLDDGENQIKELPVIVQYNGEDIEINGTLSSKGMLPIESKNLSEVEI